VFPRPEMTLYAGSGKGEMLTVAVNVFPLLTAPTPPTPCVRRQRPSDRLGLFTNGLKAPQGGRHTTPNGARKYVAAPNGGGEPVQPLFTACSWQRARKAIYPQIGQMASA
jgi:hypothetical protein